MTYQPTTPPRVRFTTLVATLCAAALSSSSLLADLLINEVRIDNGGTDLEYIELHNNGASAIDLTGHTYLVIGDGSGGSGVIESVTVLAGSIAAGGYFVIVDNDGDTLTAVDSDGDLTADLAVSADLTESLNFENGDNVTHLLAQDFSGANGDDLDTDDDGTLDILPWTSVVDVVSVLASTTLPPVDTVFAYAESLGFPNVGPDGPFAPGHVFRIADGATWAMGGFGENGGGGLLTTDGGPLFDSPEAANPTPPTGSLDLSLSVSTVAESVGFEVATLTVTRTGSTDVELLVEVFLNDNTEAALLASQIVIPANETSGTVLIDAIDDPWPDGDQIVTLTASATNYGSASTDLTVTDDVSDEFSLVVNEAYYAVDASIQDANNDGITNSNSPILDEFIELVNVTAQPLDLSFYSIADTTGEIHLIPSGTTLAPGAALVVFAGGDVSGGSTNDFGTAEIQVSSNNGLFLNDDGTETITIFNESLQEIFALDLPDQGSAPDGGSLTLSTDGDPTSPYLLHSTVSAALFSPGTEADGSNFVTLTDSLAITVNTPTAQEDSGTLAAAITVSIPSALPDSLTISLSSSDPGELGVPESIVIPAGETSIDADLLAIDDSEVDGEKIVTVAAVASGYLNGEATITIEDDGMDLPPFTGLVINEIDSDTPGSDTMEFIELYNTTSETQSLEGLVVVLYNGSDDQSYRAIGLSGTIGPNGFFVIGNPEVANVDLILEPGSSGAIQNGADAVALYVGSELDFPNDTPVATTTTLIDAIVYGTGDSDDTVLLETLTPGRIQVNEAANGSSADHAIARVPDGGAPFDTSVYQVQVPTPGNTNVIVATSGYAGFATNNGLVKGPEGDDDGDGIANLVEYALGLDPQAADPSPGTFSGNLLSFPKSATAVGNGDVTYAIKISTNLVDWDDVIEDVNDAGVISYTLPAGEPGGRRFARLEVTEN